MDLEKIKAVILSLPSEKRELFMSELIEELPKADKHIEVQASRRHILDNKMGSCPHCNHTKYVRFGKDKSAQRYKCKLCNRSFTEYTGTWMSGLHKKDKIDSYLSLMLEEKSLDKIKDTLKINKKTAFDWRHKILASFDSKNDDNQDDFTGITESDETFFLRSEKGMEVKRSPLQKTRR